MFPLLFSFDFATIRAEDIPDGVMPKRQVLGTGVSSNTPSSSTTPTTPSTSSSSVSTDVNNGGSSSTVPTTIAVTTTNSDGSTVTSLISTETVKSSPSLVKLGSTTIDPATLTHKTVVSSALVTRHTERSTFTSYYTTDGHLASSIVTTDKVVASTTGFAKTTITPSLADGGGTSNHGLSSNSKSVIGGVVGGIGGAVVIGALAFVLWRVWGKKRHGDGMDDYHSSPEKDNRSSDMSFGTDYRNPGGSVNTASNF